jgi:acetyl esterase/lipase
VLIVHASHHSVEDLQAFTSGAIPSPRWVHLTITTIPTPTIENATALLKTYLGPDGLRQIGGQKWWTWRANPLEAEWIEMKSHYYKRQKNPNLVPKRTLFYVHGGAYFFNSVAAERYQIQRHARKLQCRAFAPRYRLAPQYPFPCAVLDVLAAYLYLLQDCKIPASEILVSGDSAGGGLVLGLLCLLRDVGIPLPAGGMLISPWVDLLHSFPSIVAEAGGDYIPNYGFHHRPSLAWPPPTAEDLERLRARMKTSAMNLPDIEALAEDTRDDAMGYQIVKERIPVEEKRSTQTTEIPRLEIDSKMIELKDQFQLVAPNEVLDNPLLSPVTQASLGGLCPLLIVHSHPPFNPRFVGIEVDGRLLGAANSFATR